jgi:uncharacterized RDD family membrane protein YckC
MKSWRRKAEQLHRGDHACELEYVGFWARAWAGLLDVILLAALFSPLLQLAERGAAAVLTPGPAGLLSWLLCATAAVFFYMTPGTTPGQLAISAVVVDARTGCPPALPQRIGRVLGLLLALAPCGLGFLWVAFQPRKQGWHDKLAGTLVVRERRARRSRRASPATVIGENEAAAVARR